MRAKLQGFSSVARPRDTSLWRGEVHPDAPHLVSVTMRAKLQGLFRALPGPDYTPPWRGKVHPPRRPSLCLSVTVRAKLQGLFERCQAQIHTTPGGVKVHPTHLTLVSVRMRASSWAFRALTAHKRINPDGWIPPRCPSLWLSVTVIAKLQGLF